jgi:negative elongation factor A
MCMLYLCVCYICVYAISVCIPDNPCPQQGEILSIRLSEAKELVQQADLTQKVMMVDTYFQMNYGTGEWKRIKKQREVED